MAESELESKYNLGKVKNILSTVAAITATVGVVHGAAQEFLPQEFKDYILSRIRSFFSGFSNQLTMVIDEFEGLDTNQIYEATDAYLGWKVSPSARRFKIFKSEKEKYYNITLERDEEISDVFNGQRFKWVQVSCETSGFYTSRDNSSTF